MCSKADDPAYLSMQEADMTLDAAWNECEAALPEGWQFYVLTRHAAAEWEASASRDLDTADRYEFVNGTGPTPAAALLDLAARLTGAAE